MAEEKWNEEEVESYLKKLPNVRDERAKEEVLNRLKADSRLNHTKPPKRNVIVWVPIVATIAAVFLLMILLPKTGEQNPAFDRATDYSMEEASEEASLLADDDAPISTQSHILLEDELGDDLLLPVSLVSDEQIVPVNFVLSAGQDKAKVAIDGIDVRALGFDGYLESVDDKKTAAYFKHTVETGQAYLVPEAIDGETVESAFQNLSNPSSENLEPVVPQSVHFDVKIEQEVAKIHFDLPLDLSMMMQEDAQLLLEAFMLTAEQFNLSVEFEKISPDYFGRYDLTAPLPKPVAVNPIYFLYE